MSFDISALYQMYRKELVGHLLRIVKCPETAQDIAQDSYLILARAVADTAIEHPRGFLYRIAGNLALDHLRHNKVVERHADIEQLKDEQELPSLENEIDQQQWRALLHQTIAELPPRCRDAFMLHKIHGFSYKEVGQLLDISESAVEKHMIKGLMHCRSRLGNLYGHPYRSGQ